MLQQKISSQQLEEKFQVQNNPFYNCLIQQIMPIMTDVMINQFGNYLCQKIIEGADANTLSIIINTISNQLVFISLNIHGTRAVQTLIEKLAFNVNN